MSNISHNIVGNTLTCIVNGKVKTINKNNPQFQSIVTELNETRPDGDKILRLFSLSEAVREYVEGSMEVKGNLVYYNGEPLHNNMTQEILRFMSEGLPYKPLLRFLERLMKNSSMRSQQTLYEFLQHECLQITSDGHFISYKGVGTDYYDIHSRTILNKPGSCPPRLDPSKVDDDPQRGCSYGYHVGAYAYASHWGPVVMRVLVDPADVRCVPYDCGHQKVRCCYYRVLDEVAPQDMTHLSSRCSNWRDHATEEVLSNEEWDEPLSCLTELLDKVCDGCPDNITDLLEGLREDEGLADDEIEGLLQSLVDAVEEDSSPLNLIQEWTDAEVYIDNYTDFFDEEWFDPWFNRAERYKNDLVALCGDRWHAAYESLNDSCEVDEESFDGRMVIHDLAQVLGTSIGWGEALESILEKDMADCLLPHLRDDLLEQLGLCRLSHNGREVVIEKSQM